MFLRKVEANDEKLNKILINNHLPLLQSTPQCPSVHEEQAPVSLSQIPSLQLAEHALGKKMQIYIPQ